MKSYAAAGPRSLSFGSDRPAVQTITSVVAVLFFTVATALAAKVRIPVPGTIVPMTLQSAIVILAGLRLGARKGAISQLLYIAGGTLGLPFFAGTAGIVALFGPTGGYLIGFVLAAWVAGTLNKYFGATEGEIFMRSWIIAFVASIVLFIPGLIQLRIFTLSTWEQTIMMGLVPFLIGDVVKVTLAATAHSLGQRYVLK